MTSKLIRGEEFIAALEGAGLLPPRTCSVEIRAVVGDPVRLSYEVFGDERLVGIADDIHETDDATEAVAR